MTLHLPSQALSLPSQALKRKYPFVYGSSDGLEMEVKRRRITLEHPDLLGMPTHPVDLRDVIVAVYRVLPNGKWAFGPRQILAMFLVTNTKTVNSRAEAPPNAAANANANANPNNNNNNANANANVNANADPRPPLLMDGGIAYEKLFAELKKNLRQGEFLWANLGPRGVDGSVDEDGTLLPPDPQAGLDDNGQELPTYLQIKNANHLRRVLFLVSKQPRPVWREEPISVPILALRMAPEAGVPVAVQIAVQQGNVVVVPGTPDPKQKPNVTPGPGTTQVVPDTPDPKNKKNENNNENNTNNDNNGRRGPNRNENRDGGRNGNRNDNQNENQNQNQIQDQTQNENPTDVENAGMDLLNPDDNADGVGGEQQPVQEPVQPPPGNPPATWDVQPTYLPRIRVLRLKNEPDPPAQLPFPIQPVQTQPILPQLPEATPAERARSLRVVRLPAPAPNPAPRPPVPVAIPRGPRPPLVHQNHLQQLVNQNPPQQPVNQDPPASPANPVPQPDPATQTAPPFNNADLGNAHLDLWITDGPLVQEQNQRPGPQRPDPIEENQAVVQQPRPLPTQDDIAFLLEGTFDTADDQILWSDVCAFFQHDLLHLQEHQGKQLFGTKFPLRPHQMEAVYLFLRQSYGLGDEEVGRHHGGINAFGTGLGKTIVALAVIAVVRICELFILPGAHSPVANPDNNPECPDNHPFGIQCPCVTGSLAQKIMRAVANQQAPSIMFVHGPTVHQIYREAGNYLEEHVEFGPTNQYSSGFVKTFMCKEREITIPEDWQYHLIPQLVHTEPGIVPVVYEWNHEHVAQREIVPEPGRTTWHWRYEEEQEEVMREQHPLIIMSSDGSSLGSNTTLAKFFTREAFFQKASMNPLDLLGNGEWPDLEALRNILMFDAAKVFVEWCISPRLVVYDEFHKIRGEKTKIHTILKKWASRHYQFKLLAMSATPITRKLSESLTTVLRHILEPDNFDQYQTHVKTIETSDKRKAAREHMDAQTQLSTLLKQVIVRRTLEKKFHGRDIVKIPPMEIHRWSCKSARAREQDFKDMVQSTRAGFDRLLEQEITRQRNHAWNATLGDREVRDLALRAVLRDVGRFQRGAQDQGEGLADNNNANANDNNDKPQFSSYTRALWIGQFPNMLSMQPARWHERPTEWLNGEPIMRFLRGDGEIGDYFTGEKDAALVTELSTKVWAVEAILNEARHDQSISEVMPTPRPHKKHVVIFTSAPGEAALLAAYLKRTQDRWWRVEWVTTGAQAAELTEEDEQGRTVLFPNLRFNSERKATILIGTTLVLGTGLNGLARCAYGILFRLPWSEVEENQAMGRIHRARQRYRTKWYTLCATDGPFETMIWDRHRKRTQALGMFVGDEDEDGGDGDGDGDGQGQGQGQLGYVNGVPPEFMEWDPETNM